MKQKGFTLIELIAVVVILVAIVSISVPIIRTLILRTGDKAYIVVENNLAEVAKNYITMEDFPLSTYTYGTSIVTKDALVEENYLDGIADPLDEESDCEGYVRINKLMDGEFDYKAYISCGTNYETTGYAPPRPLITAIKEDSLLTGTTYATYPTLSVGLHQEGANDYRFIGGLTRSTTSPYNPTAGTEPDNYIHLGNATWKIVSANDSTDANLNGVKVIIDLMSYDSKYIKIWDDSCNAAVAQWSGAAATCAGFPPRNYAGINTYDGSDMQAALNDYYDDLVPAYAKPFTKTFSLCVGKTDTVTKTTNVCGTTLSNQRIGLLTAVEYIKANSNNAATTWTTFVAPNNSVNNSQNYLLVVPTVTEWTLTGHNTSTSEAWTYTSDFVSAASLVRGNTYNSNYIRPVIMIKPDALVIGTGENDNPYVLAL